MKLAIVGSGMIVGELLSFIHDVKGIELTSIIGTERSKEKLKLLASEHSIKRVSTDYEEELQCEDIDTVYIAIPNYLHYEYTKTALLAGKNVICEKPFTLKSQELDELVTIAKEKNLILLEAITNQYLENFYYIQENLHKLGDIKIVSCNYSQYSSRYDAFKEGVIAPAFDVTKGGGALLDLNIYNIHLVVGLFGEPKDAYYLGNIEKDVDTSGILMMHYEDKQAVCIGAKDCSAEIRSTIQGDKGSITISGGTNAMPRVTLRLNDGFEESVELNKANHRMTNEFVKFEEVIRTKDFNFAEKMLEHSLAVMRVVDKARL